MLLRLKFGQRRTLLNAFGTYITGGIGIDVGRDDNTNAIPPAIGEGQETPYEVGFGIIFSPFLKTDAFNLYGGVLYRNYDIETGLTQGDFDHFSFPVGIQLDVFGFLFEAASELPYKDHPLTYIGIGFSF